MQIKYRLTKVDTRALRGAFRHFGVYLKAQKGRLVISGLSALGVSLVTLANPWPIKLALDYVLIPSQPSSTSDVFSWLSEWDPMTILAFSAIAVLVISTLRGLFAYSQEVQSKAVGHQLVAKIRLRLFSHIQRLPQSYHDYRDTGELMTRLTGDMNLVQELLVSTVITLASQLVIIIGMLSLMFWMDWRLALVGVGITPLFLFAALRFSGKIQHSARKQREKYGELVSSMQESFAGISQIKGYAREKQREKIVGKSLSSDARADLKTTKLAAGYTRAVELITAVGTALALWIGVNRALDGALSAGDLIIFLAYMRGVYRPLRGVARLTTKIAKATTRAEKIIEILNMEPEVRDKPDAISARDMQGGFEFSGVSFRYDSGKQALRDFQCRLPAKKTTLIIGPTGAGKSTLAKLLLRLYEPSSGTILLDGRNITDFKVRSLRKRMTPLTQNTFLFRATVAENIAFGKSHATAEEITLAARKASAHEFIEELPDGYETLLGEDGLTLSGGQRQLISFARAALRDTPVMIFDEPATGLDIHTEARAKAALASLRRDRTVVIITHRLHFLDLADHVVFMRDGSLVGEGPPDKLRNSCCAFAEYIRATDPQAVAQEERMRVDRVE